MDTTLKIIGIIRSSLKDRSDCPLQESEDAPVATLVVENFVARGIKDLKAGSKIILLTWLHEADRSIVECVPRNHYDAPKVGVFSTRSPDRPNPIGLHETTVLKIDGNTIEVAALEVLDGTPLLDIKPVIN